MKDRPNLIEEMNRKYTELWEDYVDLLIQYHDLKSQNENLHEQLDQVLKEAYSNEVIDWEDK